MLGPGREVEPLEVFHGQGTALLAAHALIEQRQLHVLHRGLEADEIETLKDESNQPVAVFGSFGLREIADELSVDAVFAAVVVVENAEDVEQRGLARTRRAHDGYEFAFLDAQVDAFQYVERLGAEVGLVDVFQFYHAHSEADV